jgi:hypothetical protein
LPPLIGGSMLSPSDTSGIPVSVRQSLGFSQPPGGLRELGDAKKGRRNNWLQVPY